MLFIEKIVAREVQRNSDLLAGIACNLEYSAYNLCDGKKYTDLPKGIVESTSAEDTLLISIRDLKQLSSQRTLMIAELWSKNGK